MEVVHPFCAPSTAARARFGAWAFGSSYHSQEASSLCPSLCCDVIILEERGFSFCPSASSVTTGRAMESLRSLCADVPWPRAGVALPTPVLAVFSNPPPCAAGCWASSFCRVTAVPSKAENGAHILEFCHLSVFRCRLSPSSEAEHRCL